MAVVANDLESAVRILQSARSGAAEMLGVLAGDPLLVVDLDTAGDVARLCTPELLPCVVVGVSRAGTPVIPADGLDIAVTSRRAAPAPWVTVADPAAEAQRLASRVAASPMASVTLMQVLRSSRLPSVAADLALESLAYSALQAGPEFARWLGERPARAPRSLDGPPVLMARDGPRLTITLNRPEVRNAYSAAMRDGLCQALSAAAADPDVTEVHLRGNGAAFCSGGDLREFGTATDPAWAHLIRTGRSTGRLLAELADRVTAHVHGACVGAGIELPAFVHRVIADPDTRIQLPELSMGLIPGAGGTASIPRRIGRERTSWLALTGDTIDADTALWWGLVDELAPAPTG